MHDACDRCEGGGGGVGIMQGRGGGKLVLVDGYCLEEETSMA